MTVFLHNLVPLILLLISGISSAVEGRLMITGSSTVAPLVSEIAKRFESRHPGVRIEVQTGGSSRGVADVFSGLAQIGMVSRALTADEALVAHLIARDGIALIVHQANPVLTLTRDQVVGIFTGVISDWSAVGGKAGAITVVNKAEGRSTLELFCQHFALKNSAIRARVVIGDNEQGVKTVVGNPGAIGYVSIGTAQTGIDAGVTLRMLPMDGVPAAARHVLDGTWPLSRPLNLVTKGEPTGLVKVFLAFACSKDVDDLIVDLAFVAPQR